MDVETSSSDSYPLSDSSISDSCLSESEEMQPATQVCYQDNEDKSMVHVPCTLKTGTGYCMGCVPCNPKTGTGFAK